MRSKLLQLLLLWILFLGISSCERETDDFQKSELNSEQLSQIKGQIMQMGDTYKEIKQQGFNNLMASLNWSTAQKSVTSNGESIISVPSSMSTAYHREGKSVTRILMIHVSGSTVTKAYVTDIITSPELLIAHKTEPQTGEMVAEPQRVVFSGEKVFYDLGLSMQERLSYNKDRLTQQNRIVSKPQIKDTLVTSKKNVPLQSKPVQTLAMVCTDWYIITTYYYADGTSQTTEEYLTTTCEDNNCKFEPTSVTDKEKNKIKEKDLDVGILCGGTDPKPDPSAPGNKLCLNTFQNFYGGQTNSFWVLNVNGITFENGTYANKFNAGFSLANGITDVVMNSWQTNSSMGYQGTALDYLHDTFSGLFSSGDIYSQYESDGKKYWYFSKYAAQRISQWVSNMASTEVIASIPDPAMPNGTVTRDYFLESATRFIQSLMPNSSLTSGAIQSAPTAIANYSSTCN